MIVAHRAPDEKKSEEDQGLESAMSDLCQALESKDYKSAAQAFKNAMDICESQPHEEAESSYEMMNQKAAKDNE